MRSANIEKNTKKTLHIFFHLSHNWIITNFWNAYLLSELLWLGQALPNRNQRAGLFLKFYNWLTPPLKHSETNLTKFPRWDSCPHSVVSARNTRVHMCQVHGYLQSCLLGAPCMAITVTITFQGLFHFILTTAERTRSNYVNFQDEKIRLWNRIKVTQLKQVQYAPFFCLSSVYNVPRTILE